MYDKYKEGKNILPFGSVVTLKGGKRKLLVIGINQISMTNNKKYDYCGLLHPVGYLNSEELFLFNNDNIETVHFIGYEDDELKDYFDDIMWERRKKNGE